MTELSTVGADRLRRIRDRHFDCYADLAKVAWEGRGDSDEWCRVLDSEVANIRSALEWGLANERPDSAAFAAALGWYWATSRRFVEGRQILDRVLRLPELPPADRTDALHAAGMLAWDQGDVAGSRERYAAARQLAESLGDADREARAGIGLGWSLFHVNLGAPAAEAFSKAIEIASGLSPAERADAHRGLGWARCLDAGYEAALGPHREAREILEAVNDRALTTHYLVEINLLVNAGRLEEALTLSEKSLQLARTGQGFPIYALEAKAKVADAIGDRQLLRRIVDEGIAISAESVEPKWEAHFRWRLAIHAVIEGDVDRARDELALAIRLLEGIEMLNMSDLGIRAHVLMTQARLVEDDGELDVAEELIRQAIRCYSSSPRSHADALAVLGRFFAAHGDFESARATVAATVDVLERAPRASGALPRLGIDRGIATWGEMDLARSDEELMAVLSHLSNVVAEAPKRQPAALPGLLCRRASMLVEMGRLDEATADADAAIGTATPRGSDRSRSYLERARIRIVSDDAEGARSDLAAAAAAPRGGWSEDQIHVAATLARLALLEGRDERAVALWSAVQDYRAANRRVQPRLARWFEEPLVELRVDGDPPGDDSRGALDALRRIVTEEFDALTARHSSPRP